MVKRLRFFPDDMADPFWDADSGGTVDLDYLPLRDDTRKALRSSWDDPAPRARTWTAPPGG